jgi:AcrR family transcriptional regulator
LKKPQSARPRPKGKETREHIRETALLLFRRRGFEQTTMRDIAKAAGMSLGAAYYYFPSKEAIVTAYYEFTGAEYDLRTRKVLDAGVPLRERLGAVLHAHLDIFRADRKILGALFRTAADPSNPISVFSEKTRPMRDRSIALCQEALADLPLPPEIRSVLALGLWALHLVVLFYFLTDESEGQARTHRLIDDALDLLVPLVGLLALPGMDEVGMRLREALERAGLMPAVLGGPEEPAALSAKARVAACKVKPSSETQSGLSNASALGAAACTHDAPRHRRGSPSRRRVDQR